MIMEFVNLDKFENWLKEKLKCYSNNLSVYCDDLEKQLGETGMNIFELDKNETKSGNADCLSFETKVIYYDENNSVLSDEECEDAAYCETIITF